MSNIKKVGDGKVVLIAGGGKIYTDIAARFVRSEKPITEIIDSPYSKQIVDNILSSGHSAALEFDQFIFGVEGYSRVCEIQLVRKRHASYLIKSGRQELDGKRKYDIVIPKSLMDTSVTINNTVLIPRNKFTLDLNRSAAETIVTTVSIEQIISLLEQWYNQNLDKGIPEEDLRYLKPQATEFKGIVAMNASGLRSWFQIRCCMCAQAEIRDMANKMLKLCKKAAPDLFKDAGPSCKSLGYCPENKRQHEKCIGKIMQKDDAIKLIKQNNK